MIRAVALANALALMVTSPAAAEIAGNSAQAQGARAGFLAQAIPLQQAAAICLVDTGVTPNPDTPGVVDRIALDGSVSDLSPTGHGTRMAMFIGAPANGWGMVGIWPSARIVSVRASIAGQDAFTPAGYNFGLKQCDKDAKFYGIKVAVLALSSETQLTADENEALNGTIAAARAHGLSVVVAGGNNDGRPPGVPANLPGALSIGAASAGTGVRCAFSATAARLNAPGCGLDGADPASGVPTSNEQGTSHASAIVAATLAALRTWRPDLSPDDADRLLETTAAPSSDGPLLDATAAFTAAGLASLIPSTPVSAATPSPTVAPTSTPQAKVQLPKPKLSVRTVGRSKHAISVRIANRPKGVRALVRIYARSRTGKLRIVISRTRSSSAITIVVRKWHHLTVSFLDPSGQRLTSLPATASPRR